MGNQQYRLDPKESPAALNHLKQVFQIVASPLDPQAAKRQAIFAAQAAMGAQAASLFLIDPKTDELFFEIAVGPAGEKIEKLRLPKNVGIVGQVISSGKTIVLDDAQIDPDHTNEIDNITGLQTHSLICSPLIVQGNILGALEAIDPEIGKFNREHKDVFELLAGQVAIFVENTRLYQRLQQSFEETVASLVATIEKRDPYTGGHTQRVVEGAQAIALKMGLDPLDIDRLRMSGFLHDIGKIGIADSILHKPKKLTLTECQTMKTHPGVGVEIFEHIADLADLAPVVLHHHEYWNGEGYPGGLAGPDIPLLSRILSVADSYDAMTSDRPYRKALPHAIAVDEIVNRAGIQYDPEVVRCFLEAIQTGTYPVAR